MAQVNLNTFIVHNYQVRNIILLITTVTVKALIIIFWIIPDEGCSINQLF